jgi:transposase-like protein
MTVSLVASIDRRSSNRLPTPACPQCGTEESVIVVIRTRRFVYFRCHRCRELLPTPIPPVELGHGFVAHVTD